MPYYNLMKYLSFTVDIDNSYNGFDNPQKNMLSESNSINPLSTYTRTPIISREASIETGNNKADANSYRLLNIT
jgi:hypothetical protein